MTEKLKGPTPGVRPIKVSVKGEFEIKISSITQ